MFFWVTYTVFRCTFRTGYRFYYWDYYKDKNALHDHHYENSKLLRKSSLFIKIKSTLKEEILNNKQHCLSLIQWSISLEKAKKYKSSRIVKVRLTTTKDYLHYEIQNGSTLSLDHLMAVILYTDHSELSSHFTATFRRVDYSESVESVKRKNKEYASWSRLLRECVEYWGSIGWNRNQNYTWNKDHNRVSGPFYCGMNITLDYVVQQVHPNPRRWLRDLVALTGLS